MQHSCIRTRGARLRRRVFGSALAMGLAAALVPGAADLQAADLQAANLSPAPVAVQPDAPAGSAAPHGARRAATGTSDSTSPDSKAANPNSDAKAGEENAGAGNAHPAEANSDGDVSLDGHVIIEKGSKHIRMQGLGRDREYDSFEQFVQDAPWLAGLVFLSVLLVFLVPLLVIVLLIWYKLRKNRLANETMLKLAERGAITPAAAMDAVAAGMTASALAAATLPADQPAYEQARYLRRRTAWSDLRKGVILSGVGLGLAFFSLIDDGTPNSVGLVCLFVGLGYCLLWFLEDRPGGPRRDSRDTPPAGGA